MPLGITKKNGKFCVTDPAGKQFGCHPTKQRAIDQIAAIEESKKRRHKSALDLAAEENINSLVADAASQPPIVIMSDGSAEGTMLMVNGQLVPFSRLEIYCSNNPEYPNCELSVTIDDISPDGMNMTRTLRLRKSPPPEVAS